jgi:transposase
MSPEVNMTPPQEAFKSDISLIAWLLQIIVALLEELQVLRTNVAELEKDSTNSHKPPSSDGLKKKRGATGRGSSGRKPGAQKGHPGSTRRNVPPSEVTETIAHKPQACEQCGVAFTEQNLSIPLERRQVWEIPEIKPLVQEHVFYQTRCDCGHTTRLPLPEWLYSGMGDNLQAHVTYFTAEAKLSRRSLQTILNDVFHIPVALGTIQNRLEDTSEILKPVCDELEDELSEQSVINIDETSYPHNKTLNWLWAFVSSSFVFFTIQASRGSQVLRQILGELYDGIIICDRFSAYVKYHKDRACGLIQLCWAHIIRDIKALKHHLAVESGQIFAVVMRKRIGAVFRLWHAHKQGKISRAQLIAAAEPSIAEMRAFVETNQKNPCHDVAKFNRQLLKRWDSLFTFIYHESVEPTNNLAERLIRPGVQTRKISYCTRSQNGQLLRARLLTVSQSCRIQQRNTLDFYRTAIHAHRHKLTMPSLLINHKLQHLEMTA